MRPVLVSTELTGSVGGLRRRAENPNRQQDNARLLRKIRNIHSESDGVFGSPRVWEELRYDGEPCGLNRVAKLMNASAIVGIPA